MMTPKDFAIDMFTQAYCTTLKRSVECDGAGMTPLSYWEDSELPSTEYEEDKLITKYRILHIFNESLKDFIVRELKTIIDNPRYKFIGYVSDKYPLQTLLVDRYFLWEGIKVLIEDWKVEVDQPDTHTNDYRSLKVIGRIRDFHNHTPSVKNFTECFDIDELKKELGVDAIHPLTVCISEGFEDPSEKEIDFWNKLTEYLYNYFQLDKFDPDIHIDVEYIEQI